MCFVILVHGTCHVTDLSKGWQKTLEQVFNTTHCNTADFSGDV